MTGPYQSDHEQRALMIHGIKQHMFHGLADKPSSVRDAIQKHAEDVTDAILEAQDAYNVAKAADAETVTVSRKAINALVIIAARAYGMSFFGPNGPEAS